MELRRSSLTSVLSPRKVSKMIFFIFSVAGARHNFLHRGDSRLPPSSFQVLTNRAHKGASEVFFHSLESRTITSSILLVLPSQEKRGKVLRHVFQGPRPWPYQEDDGCPNLRGPQPDPFDPSNCKRHLRSWLPPIIQISAIATTTIPQYRQTEFPPYDQKYRRFWSQHLAQPELFWDPYQSRTSFRTTGTGKVSAHSSGRWSFRVETRPQAWATSLHQIHMTWRKRGCSSSTVRKPRSASLSMPMLVAKRRWGWSLTAYDWSFDPSALCCKSQSQREAHRFLATATNFDWSLWLVLLPPVMALM